MHAILTKPLGNYLARSTMAKFLYLSFVLVVFLNSRTCLLNMLTCIEISLRARCKLRAHVSGSLNMEP